MGLLRYVRGLSHVWWQLDLIFACHLAGAGQLGKFVATLRGHVGAVYRLAWSADSRMLVSASKDATVKVSVTRTRARYLFDGCIVTSDLGPQNVQNQVGPSWSYRRGLLRGFRC
jgi:WD40 repeat protein